MSKLTCQTVGCTTQAKGKQEYSKAAGACLKAGLAEHSMQVGAQHLIVVSMVMHEVVASGHIRPAMLSCIHGTAAVSANSTQEVRLVRRSLRNVKTQSWRELF